MKKIKEIISEVFDAYMIIILVSVFISGMIVFTLLLGDTFLVALKDSFVITVAMAIFVMFGVYIKKYFNKE